MVALDISIIYSTFVPHVEQNKAPSSNSIVLYANDIFDKLMHS